MLLLSAELANRCIFRNGCSIQFRVFSKCLFLFRHLARLDWTPIRFVSKQAPCWKVPTSRRHDDTWARRQRGDAVEKSTASKAAPLNATALRLAPSLTRASAGGVVRTCVELVHRR